MKREGLRVRGVGVDLAGRPVLRGVDIDVPAGSVLGLIGPNGAGKTTLLRAILGLVPLRSGTIRLHSRPLSEARSLVGYVPQRHEFAWDFPVTVAGAVMTGRVRRIGWFRRPGPEDRRAVSDALALVDLTDLRDRPVGELSGGQRQRVLVGRALALAPELLLLDEPFVGLDVPTQELLLELFRKLAGNGTAVLVTTHDLAAATSVSDRFCLLNRSVVAEGSPQELRDPAIWLEAFGVSRSAQLAALGEPAGGYGPGIARAAAPAPAWHAEADR